jgi:RNA polymerase sigma-70 factor (ECF subfamily)
MNQQGGTHTTRDTAVAFVLDDPAAAERELSVEDRLVRLMDAHERSIYTFTFTLVRDPDRAADCTQDTFIRAFEHLRQGKPITTAWLFTVARNRAMDEFRRRKRVQVDSEALDDMPHDDKVDLALSVQSVLEQLSPPDREVLYLFDIAGFKTDEIGEMLGVRGSAIRQRLSRARERFRAIYGARI